MSSPPRHFFRDSSPDRRSLFTYRHLALLAASSPSSPLRVVAHIDLDAFYAQCEVVRTGTPPDHPLAVQQWQGLIAINYPARKFGINRLCNVTEAKKKCPDLICQHVATWREGDTKWAYRDDAASHITTDKVSLDPYRLESRKILALIKECLPPNQQKVEKAGIDEVFIDLSAQVHATMLTRYPELASHGHDDPTARLPLPSITFLDWKADALVDLDEDTEMDTFADWDDVAMLVASEIVRDIRAAIHEKLKYTCSAGIAKNKMLSKLGSGHKKPNQQTVVRNRAVPQFLSKFKLTKIRNLGGKLGDSVVSIFNTDGVDEILPVSLDQMKAKLGEETGIWLYNTIRGVDMSEVSSRTKIKSMLSAKTFQPSIKTEEQAKRWLRIFVADIFSRLIEEGVLENKRRPRTISLHHRHRGTSHGRQCSIPTGKPLDEELLYELAVGLLHQTTSEGNIWPCSHLDLSVGGLEDGVTGNMGIDGFLVKGEEAQALRPNVRGTAPSLVVHDRTAKKRSAEDGGIQRFLTKKNFGEVDEHSQVKQLPRFKDGEDNLELATMILESKTPKRRLGEESEWVAESFSEDTLQGHPDATKSAESKATWRASSENHEWAGEDFSEHYVGEYGERSEGTSPQKNETVREHIYPAGDTSSTLTRQRLITSYMCSRCPANFGTADELQSHEDWHIAKDLDEEERGRVAPAASPGSSHIPDTSSGPGTTKKAIRGNHAGAGSKRTNRKGKLEHGQRKLKFG